MASTESSRAANNPPKRSSPLRTVDADDEEEAERTLVSNLELRRQNATTGSSSKRSGWDASVEGEHPPLPGVPMNDQFLLAGRQQPPKGTPALLFNSMSKQWNIARGVKALGRSGKMALMKRITEEHVQREPMKTPTAELLSSFRLQKNADGMSSSRTDIWVESAIKVNELLENERGAEAEETSSNANTPTESSSYLFEIDNSAEPLLPTTSADSDPNISSYGATGSGTGGGKKQKKKPKKSNDTKKAQPFWCLPRSHFGLAEIINPAAFIQGLLRFFFASTFTFVTFPCIVVGAILFHYMGNPSLSFLPGDASLSWWLVFIARQALILELVIIIQYLAVEGIALRTKWMVYTCGPLVTLWFINAKGWPLMAILWSLLDLGLLHGDAPWQQNWLYYLEIPFFSSENPGGQIINSDFYLRILLSALLAGSCHAIKRTHVALAFGRSTFLTYMAPLEEILADMVLITEVAELATELQNFGGTPNRILSGRVHSLLRHHLDVKYQTKGTSDFEGDLGEMNRSSSSHNVEYSSDGGDSLDSLDNCSDADSGDDNSEDGELSKEGDMEDNDDAKTRDQISFNPSRVPSATFYPGSSTGESFFEGSKKSGRFSGATEGSVRSTETTTSRLKQQLDRWQEPQNKLDKSIDVSIADILKFRKALTYMDDPFPFGFAFGPGATRNQVIRSSQKTYRRLIRSANLVTLSYDVLMLLAINEDDTIDAVKDRALKRLFRPDHHKQLTLLSFVQTCDTVYKKLRYFRASVGNASVINKVLESIVDSIINFFLALVIMTILEYNPYPVLVSLSTVMVSLAFAVGSSASKYIEGVLLIAVRRPFDIGDRIMITQPAQGDSGGPAQSWFVEDINLWCTTLRYSATNEIAIVSNGILSTLRIVNCNRSPNAMFNISLNFELDNVDNGKIELFRQGLAEHLRGQPRIYEGLVSFRCDSIDTKLKVAQYSIRIRHRRSWQDAVVVLRDRGEIIAFCIKLGNDLGINNVQVPIQVEAVSTKETPEPVPDSASDALAVLSGSIATSATTSSSVQQQQI